jgi:hypothetical protein
MNGITFDLIQKNLAITWDFYDHPLSGLIKIDESYFIFKCTKTFEPYAVGLDEQGEPEFDWIDPEYTLESIGSIQAAYHIIRHSLFKFCVYNVKMGCLDGPKQPWLVKFARKLGNNKSDMVHNLVYRLYFNETMQGNPVI